VAALRTDTPHRLQNDHSGRGDKSNWDIRAHDVSFNERESGSRRARASDERDAPSPRRGDRYMCPLSSFLEQQSPYTLAQGNTVVGETVHQPIIKPTITGTAVVRAATAVVATERGAPGKTYTSSSISATPQPPEGRHPGRRGGMRSEHLGEDEEQRCGRHVGSSAAKTQIGRSGAPSVGVSGSFGSEDFQTAVKTNLPTLGQPENLL
jgi:hypothetical protein